MDTFIELNRSFYGLSDYAKSPESDDVDIREAFREGKYFQWDNLLEDYRVVLLSEAGAGKTKEILQTAKKLKEEQKRSFFIRIENMLDDFESSFEVGDHSDFMSWINSGGEAWLFLDSVDEARLKSPRDFEKAIKKISKVISNRLRDVHLYITSRVSAWRPKSDLDLCEFCLPYDSPIEVNNISEDGITLDDEIIDQKVSHNNEKNIPFKIITLKDLDQNQVEFFCNEYGLKNTGEFLKAVEKKDAWYFTSRPEDLIELIHYWKDKKEIGTRLELIENSISHRLKERDQNRSEASDLSLERK